MAGISAEDGVLCQRCSKRSCAGCPAGDHGSLRWTKGDEHLLKALEMQSDYLAKVAELKDQDFNRYSTRMVQAGCWSG